jgi:hypothetical protein
LDSGRSEVYQRVWEGVHEDTGERAWVFHHPFWVGPLYPREESAARLGGARGVGSLLGLRSFALDGEGGACSAFGWVDGETLAARWAREGAAKSAAGACEALGRVAHAVDALEAVGPPAKGDEDDPLPEGSEAWRVLPCDVWLARGGEGGAAWLMPLARLRAECERERYYSGSEPRPAPPDLHGLAPESIRGMSTDARARVFALSSLLHRWLSGAGLVEVTEGESFLAALLPLMEGRFRPVQSSEPRALGAMQRLLRRGLAVQPKLRHADAGAWMEEALGWAAVDAKLRALSVSEALVWARARLYELGAHEELLDLIASRPASRADEPLWAYLWDHSGAQGLAQLLREGAPTRWAWGVGARLPQAREALWGAARDPRSSESARVLAARLLVCRLEAGLDGPTREATRAWLEQAREGRAEAWLARVASGLLARHFEPAQPTPLELPVPALPVPAPPQPPALDVPRFGEG